MVTVNLACIQMNSGPALQENLAQAAKLIREAAKGGAQFIATPENTDFMRANAALTVESAYQEKDHPALPFFSALAKELSVWLLIGSMKIKQEKDKVVNRSYLFNDKGERVASYDKIHLFDVDLADGESYRESDSTNAGTRAVMAQTPWAKLGMSICYDVRFSKLYRDMAQQGAQVMAIPAAFTVPTGKAHWEILLRARAIETGSFVIAPAQGGEHEGGRGTYGHSMVISPWGKILAQKADNEMGVLHCTIDLSEVDRARRSIPSLTHDRDYEIIK